MARKRKKGGTPENTPQMKPLVPDAYEPVSSEALEAAPLNMKNVKSSKKRLWLIKVPHNFDSSTLNGQHIILNGIQDLPSSNTQNGERYEIQACHVSDQDSTFRLVVPSTEENCSVAVKPFTGQLTVLQKISVPHIEPRKESQPQVVPKDDDSHIHPRWKPFGYKKPKRRGDLQTKGSQTRTKAEEKKNNIQKKGKRKSEGELGESCHEPKKKRRKKLK